MRCTLSDVKNKEIIDTKTGTKIGFTDDIEFETDGLTVKALLVFGRLSLFGLFGKEDDIRVNASDIELIGKDTILISGDRLVSPKNDKIKVKNLCK